MASADITRFIGIPFRDQGRDFTGVDCHGLAVLFHRHVLGQEIPSYTADYHRAHDNLGVAKAIEKHMVNWEPVVSEPQVGDLIIFRVRGWPSHVGVCLGNGQFLHCLAGTRSVIERLDNITWRNRIAGVIRWAPR